MIRNRWLALFIGCAAFLPIGCGADDGISIQGCGATFPAPLYKRWFLEFYKQSPEVRVNYQAIGSSAGIRQLEEGLVHFGATDEALTEKRLHEVAKKISDREGRRVELVQIPLTAGSIAICYNVPGNPRLRLSREVYVGIILGQIKKWNDSQIQAVNPGVELPNMDIVFIRRAEGSGTTFNFTNHLNAADPRWTTEKGGPGKGKSVQWPVGVGGKGNAGVAALVQQTPGSIGYLETGYAELTDIPIAVLRNKRGNWVEPSAEASRAALAEAKLDKVLGGSVPDPKGDNAYPIVTFTWVVCRKHYDDPQLGEKLKAVLQYCLESGKPQRGQEISPKLGYIPMPADTLAEARKAVASINAD
jgi:phosphate transport system substrate-binding protein